MALSPDKNEFEVEQDDTQLSKTQLKNQSNDLQKLGVSLVDLSPAALAKIPMDQELLDAVLLAQRILRKKEGYRRQLQLIGKLMRHRDVTPIEQALLQIQASHQKSNQKFHKLEVLRDNLIAQGDSAIEELLEDHPALERQKLRQLVRQAAKQRADNKPPKAARELFKYLQYSIDG
ncbi:ribosome biogenesis factor YjgA [Paraglaciecola sp. 20A4]|uniref:ribosome biogenesis factor YjgA n=1 Tax=Paraglaciecola sp. 20A4 TaxID=2687288 RepID=UPI0014080293|nr:ribosome biogenesis factor YjgA [Paraglaciecola sp. 20A4]